MNFTSVPEITITVLTILALLSAAWAVVRSAFAKSQIEGLRGDRDDLQSRLSEARIEITECRNETNRLRSELESEVRRRQALELVVTGKRELERVQETLRIHDRRAAHIETMVQEIRDGLAS